MSASASARPTIQTSVALPPGLLRDRVALVTGGSRGVGRATALRLAEAGAGVALTFREDECSARRVEEAVRSAGGRALALRLDVADMEQTEAAVRFAAEEFGRVDIVVANAGIWQGAPVQTMTEAMWDTVLDVNLKGTWAVCRAAVAQMRSQPGGGSIVIVSSTAGQRGEAGYSNYAASKGGQISFAKSLAAELAPAIRVNCVAPGWVETGLNDPVFRDEHYHQRVRSEIPLRRIAEADDVALAIAFLASDWARHITGEVLNVNGGAVLCG